MTTRDEAIGNFAQILVNACAEQARAVAAGGARAAAEAAWFHGHPMTTEALAAELAALHGTEQHAGAA